jgi:hypothetical protein
MGESPEIELVRRTWDALIQGGPEVLGEVLAPDAQWYGVEDGQLCDGRKAIIDVMSRNLAGRGGLPFLIGGHSLLSACERATLA